MSEVKKPIADKKVADTKAEIKETVKADAAKVAEVKKAAPKKAAPKKPAAKKTEVKENIVIQRNGVDIATKDLFKNARAAYKKAGNKDEIKEVTIYVNTDEGKYYPVVNGAPVDGLDL